VLTRILQVLPILSLAAVASAQSPFSGDWKLDPQRSRLPDEMKIQSKGDNTYVFDFGGGSETIVADGSDQAGLDNTQLSVKATRPDTWIVRRKKAGRLWIEATWKLSNHDSMLTDAYRQFQPDGSTLDMDYVYRRIGNGAGIAADWQSIKETMNSPFVLHVKPLQGGGFSFASPLGTTDAALENENHEVPSAGQGTLKTVRRVGDRMLVVTIKQDGKQVATEDVVLSADLKTLTMTVHVVGHDRPNVLTFERI
jgi:hypothetical protein